MRLFTPFYMNDWNFQDPRRNRDIEKVKGVSNQRKLARIATRAPDDGYRTEAAAKLDDAALLERIALGDRRKFVRASAVKRLAVLGAEEALARIALRGDGPRDFSDTAGEAANAMSDKERLAEIARSAPLADARRYAVAKLDDPEALRAAASDENEHVRAAALRRIDDPSVLARAALSGKGYSVDRMAAIRNPHLKDPSVLAEIAIHAEEPLMMKSAIEGGRITDPEALKRVALESASPWIRADAISQIEDVGMLSQIASAECTAPDMYPSPMGFSRNVPAWAAALRLSRIAPELAVEPLVKLMLKDRDVDLDKDWRQEAIRFLIDRYTQSASGDIRDRIRALPNGMYGYSSGEDCSHCDSFVHFDLPR